MTNTRTPAVLGIGNALVDIMTRLKDEKLLEEYQLPKGSMTLVDDDFSNRLYAATEGLHKDITSGGSAANTIHGVAQLDVPCGYIGKVGDDEFGVLFEHDLKKLGIKPTLLKGNNATGKAIALVTEDSERTFATNLGAALELSPEDLKPEHFQGFAYLHIEGYLVQNHALIETAMQLAKAEGLKVSIDMASFNIVEEHKAFLTRLVAGYVDIVFANEEEAKAFTGLEPEAALDEIGKQVDIAVVKIGKNGSLIQQNGKTVRVGVPPTKSIDTTGAGDNYAAGFLCGLAKGLPLSKCGEMGTLLARNVIQVMGARMDNTVWDQIRTALAPFIG